MHGCEHLSRGLRRLQKSFAKVRHCIRDFRDFRDFRDESLIKLLLDLLFSEQLRSVLLELKGEPSDRLEIVWLLYSKCNTKAKVLEGKMNRKN